MAIRQIKTSKKKIKEYWYRPLKVLGKIKTIKKYDFIQKDYCFACLRTDSGVDRAHIVAHMDGGPDNAENLHLLCRGCHRQSESIFGFEYFEWFKKQNAMHSFLYDVTRYSGASTQMIYNQFIKEKLEDASKITGFKLDSSNSENVVEWFSMMKFAAKNMEILFGEDAMRDYHNPYKKSPD